MYWKKDADITELDIPVIMAVHSYMNNNIPLANKFTFLKCMHNHCVLLIELWKPVPSKEILWTWWHNLCPTLYMYLARMSKKKKKSFKSIRIFTFMNKLKSLCQYMNIWKRSRRSRNSFQFTGQSTAQWKWGMPTEALYILEVMYQREIRQFNKKN